jgi:hypothetical protein
MQQVEYTFRLTVALMKLTFSDWQQYGVDDAFRSAAASVASRTKDQITILAVAGGRYSTHLHVVPFQQPPPRYALCHVF